MPRFVSAHATHPDGHMALALVAAQLDAQRHAGAGAPWTPTLGWLYFTDAYTAQAEALLAEARQRWPGTHWVGAVGIGVLAGGVEYIDEPALVAMLSDLPATQFTMFSGRQALTAATGAHVAQVHADPSTPDLPELLAELAERTASGWLFGGLASGRGRGLHIADEVVDGGLSGVAFGPGVALLARVTQGCQPVGPTHRITAVEDHLVLTLDDQPALPLLLAELGLSMDQPARMLAGLRRTLAGITDPGDAALGRGGQFGADTRVRHLIGIDPGREAVAIAEPPQAGQQLAFCRRDVDAARRDLVRICAEIRDELDADAAGRIAGALYVSCSGRGGPHFGAPSAEAQLLRHALGDVPLAGFFAAGEVARHHLFGYTGVLVVFVQHDPAAPAP